MACLCYCFHGVLSQNRAVHSCELCHVGLQATVPYSGPAGSPGRLRRYGGRHNWVCAGGPPQKRSAPDRRPVGGTHKGGRALASYPIIASQRGSRHATEQALCLSANDRLDRYPRQQGRCALRQHTRPTVASWAAIQTLWPILEGQTDLVSAIRHWTKAPPEPQCRLSTKPFDYDHTTRLKFMQTLFWI